MTLRWADGFDFYTTLSQLGYTVGDVTIQTSGGRTGNNFARCRAVSIAPQFTKVLTSKSTLIAGFACLYTGTGSSIAARICGFLDGATEQISLWMTADGKLTCQQGANVRGTSTTQLLLRDTWNYIEVKATFQDATGTFEVKVNGVQRLNLTNIDTKGSANTTADRVAFGHNSAPLSNTDWHFDDIYICDTDGTVNNDFLGDIKVVTLLPSGAGTNTVWTPSAGANYTTVDEVPPNSDTDYVSSGTPNDIDTYAFGNLTGTVTIKGLIHHQFTRKDDAGARQTTPAFYISATNYVGTSVAPSTSYQYFNEIFETSPASAAAWTQSEVDGAEFGVKVIA